MGWTGVGDVKALTCTDCFSPSYPVRSSLTAENTAENLSAGEIRSWHFERHGNLSYIGRWH